MPSLVNMKQLIVLHSAFGLDESTLAFAQRLREEGYSVRSPDLYRGDVARGTVADAIALRESIGVPTIISRAAEALTESNDETAVVGLSMGGALAHHVVSMGSRAKGLVLLDNISPFDARIPVPASVHVCERDQYVLPPIDRIREISANSQAAELFVYDSDRHMPAVKGSRDYDEAIAELIWKRMTSFLRGLWAERKPHAAPDESGRR